MSQPRKGNGKCPCDKVSIGWKLHARVCEECDRIEREMNKQEHTKEEMREREGYYYRVLFPNLNHS